MRRLVGAIALAQRANRRLSFRERLLFGSNGIITAFLQLKAHCIATIN